MAGDSTQQRWTQQVTPQDWLVSVYKLHVTSQTNINIHSNSWANRKSYEVFYAEVSASLYLQMPGEYLRLGHDHFIPNNFQFTARHHLLCWFRWQRGLRRWSVIARLLRSQILSFIFVFVSAVCCAVSGLCDELISGSGNSYRVCMRI